jgi:hypothetical protein
VGVLKLKSAKAELEPYVHLGNGNESMLTRRVISAASSLQVERFPSFS